MKDTEYNDLVEMTFLNGVFIPSNQKAIELSSGLKDGQKTYLKCVTARDISLHNCYFSLLNYTWLWLPDNFKKRVPCDQFYKFLKMLQGQYEVIYEFKDGTKMIEYKSIAFGKMSNEKFKEFVKEQISVIYNDIIMELFKDSEQANMIIENIEAEYEKFFSKL